MINKAKFELLCRLTQMELKGALDNALTDMGYDVINDDGYLYAQGTIPILLVAHMDTVHKDPVKLITYSDDGNTISSPQGIGGDDRCGIYMIMEIIKKHRCSVLFAEDEEMGCIGAKKFVKNNYIKDLEFNYMIELDRKGSKDAVFYECDNPEFEEFITRSEDWETAPGIFTDICTLAPEIGCAAVNFSCGYYNAHTTKEYVVLPEMEANINKVCKLIERTTADDKFEFIQAKSKWLSGGWTTGWGDYDDEDFYKDDLYGDAPMGLYGITYINEQGLDEWAEVYARSTLEAAGVFLSEHTNMTFSEIDVEFYGIDDYYM